MTILGESVLFPVDLHVKRASTGRLVSRGLWGWFPAPGDVIAADGERWVVIRPVEPYPYPSRSWVAYVELRD